MKSIEEIRLEIVELNNSYKAGEMTYKSYKRKFSVIKSYNSTSNQIKRFGAKVIKSSFGYEYIGKNFNCDVWLDGCVTDFWTTRYNGDNDQIYTEVNEGGYSFETKDSALYFLLVLDQSL